MRPGYHAGVSAEDDYWTRERDYGGILPQSLDRMRENAHRVLASSVLTSRTEQGMARAILYLLDEIGRLRQERR